MLAAGVAARALANRARSATRSRVATSGLRASTREPVVARRCVAAIDATSPRASADRSARSRRCGGESRRTSGWRPAGPQPKRRRRPFSASGSLTTRKSVGAARRGSPARSDEVAEVDARARPGRGGGVVAPVALARERRAGPGPEAGRDDVQPGGEQLIAHREQLARGLAQRRLDEDQACPPGASSVSHQARTRRARARSARSAASTGTARSAGARRRSDRSAPSTARAASARQMSARDDPRAPATRSTDTTSSAAPKRARSAAPAAPVPAPRSSTRAAAAARRRAETSAEDLRQRGLGARRDLRARTPAAAPGRAGSGVPDQLALRRPAPVNREPRRGAVAVLGADRASPCRRCP